MIALFALLLASPNRGHGHGRGRLGSSTTSAAVSVTTGPTTSVAVSPIISTASYSTFASTATSLGSPTKTFTLNIATGTVSPDGFAQTALLANGQLDYPIIVDKGDSVEVIVINGLDVPTSLHWHGIFQLGTPWYDGAGGVTQCPIPPGREWNDLSFLLSFSFKTEALIVGHVEFMTYKFSVGQQAGTYWWHAHYKVSNPSIHMHLFEIE